VLKNSCGARLGPRVVARWICQKLICQKSDPANRAGSTLNLRWLIDCTTLKFRKKLVSRIGICCILYRPSKATTTMYILYILDDRKENVLVSSTPRDYWSKLETRSPVSSRRPPTVGAIGISVFPVALRRGQQHGSDRPVFTAVIISKPCCRPFDVQLQ
jgi:hypothetical protein